MSSFNPECRIDSIVKIDSKGQIVIPKKLREKAGLKQNGKIALVTCEKEGAVWCVMLIRAEKLGKSVKETLRSVF